MKIHCLVRYKCCFCGAENTDDGQFFELRKNVHAYGPSSLSEKEEQIVRDIKNQTGRQTAPRNVRDVLASSAGACGSRTPAAAAAGCSGSGGSAEAKTGKQPSKTAAFPFCGFAQKLPPSLFSESITTTQSGRTCCMTKSI